MRIAESHPTQKSGKKTINRSALVPDRNRSRSNRKLAVLLAVVALGFFVLGWFVVVN
jgi:hypothetical protein